MMKERDVARHAHVVDPVCVSRPDAAGECGSDVGGRFIVQTNHRTTVSLEERRAAVARCAARGGRLHAPAAVALVEGGPLMARRRRPEGVRFADMPAHLRRFVPEAGSIPAATRPLGSRGAALTGRRSSTCASRSGPSGSVRWGSTTRCGRSPPMVNRRVMAMTDDVRD